MADSPDEWPREEYQLAPAEYLAAFGQFSFVYNMLESVMRNIFIHCAPLPNDFALRLFHNLGNRDRIDLFTAFVSKNEEDNEVLQSLLACALHYDICTENRNILMHSTYFSPNIELTLLVKRASNDAGRNIHYDVPLTDLRLIADQTAETFKFARDLSSFLSAREFIAHLPPTDPITGYPNIGLNPLPEIPHKPRKLTTFQPEAARKVSPRQPPSSEE